jgi:hypothetical protein
MNTTHSVAVEGRMTIHGITAQVRSMVQVMVEPSDRMEYTYITEAPIDRRC